MLLIIDCYLDDEGGAKNITPLIQGARYEVWRPTREPPIHLNGWSGVVISGSGACISNHHQGYGMRDGWMEQLSDWILRFSNQNTPMLGLCFGHQIIGHSFGGTVFKREIPEVGVKGIEVNESHGIFKGFGDTFSAFVSHEDELDNSGKYDVLASTSDCPVHAIKVHKLPIWGVQFHVEMMFEEALSLLTYRQTKHQNLHLELDKEIQKIRSHENQKERLFTNFLKSCHS